MSKIIIRKVLAKSLKELMRQKPFNKISVDEICRAADVSRRNFYRYFADKYELLAYIFRDEFFGKLTYHEDWTIWDYFPEICRYCYTERAFVKNAVQIEGQNSARAFWTEMLTPYMLRDFDGAFLSEDTAKFYIERTTNALFDFIQEWVKTEPCMPPEEFALFVRRSAELHAKRTWEITSRAPRCTV